VTSRARSEEGASSVEYGLIVFAIAGLVTLIVFSFGLVNRELFADSCQEVRDGYDSVGMTGPSCP
jgi:Flp pilus assembly pilin Flp